MRNDDDAGDDTRDDTSMPRWVKAFGIIFIVFVLVIVVLHLTGRGFGGHMQP
jgi:hypothetical protein